MNKNIWLVLGAISLGLLGWWYLSQQLSQEPIVVGTNPVENPVVSVPIEHPVATGGITGEEPSTNVPEPVVPPAPDADYSPPDESNQPEPVVPPAPDADTSPPDESKQPQPVEPPFVYPTIEHKPIIVEPHKPKPKVHHKTTVPTKPWPMHHNKVTPIPLIQEHKNSKQKHNHNRHKRKHYYCKQFCVPYKDKGYYYQLTPHHDW